MVSSNIAGKLCKNAEKTHSTLKGEPGCMTELAGVQELPQRFKTWMSLRLLMLG